MNLLFATRTLLFPFYLYPSLFAQYRLRGSSYS